MFILTCRKLVLQIVALFLVSSLSGCYVQGVTAVDVQPAAIQTDSSNNVYVSGYSSGGLDGQTLHGHNDLYFTKYDTTGLRKWTVQLGATSAYAYSNALAVDASSNVYVTGSTGGALSGQTQHGSYDLFLLKFNSSGSQ